MTTVEAHALSHESKDHGHKQWLGHPRGLAYIVFTEAWERFSFYGMQALMVLYMSTYLFKPENIVHVIGYDSLAIAMEWVFGELTTQGVIAQLFGLYIGLVYLAPVIGGYLGDRYLGRRIAVLSGAAAMAVGHFLMAFEASFLWAMLALIIGSGLLKGNLAAQVGELYQIDDGRRDAAYSYYSVAINIGAFVAPLICGTLGELYGWHYGFGAAGVGMVIGIGVYLSGLRYLPVSRVSKSRGQSLTTLERKKVLLLFFIMLMCSLYWIGQTQVWNSYPLWVKSHVDRDVLGWSIPVTWFQSIDTLAVLLFAPLVLAFWRRQRKARREPHSIYKISVGCALFAVACGLLAVGNYYYPGGERQVPLVWPLIFHALCAFAYLYCAPVALSLASRCTPESLNSMMVGAFYISIFIGSLVSGKLGGYYAQWSISEFWLVHGSIALCGSVLFLSLAPYFISVLDTASPTG